MDIDKTNPVLVTGAEGYIAGVVIVQLLELGLTVHATVRDPTDTSTTTYLNTMSKKAPGTLELFKADLLEEESYNEAMTGCSIVFHIASPFILNPQDPVRDVIEPAVNGTKNVLASASRTPTVKRVVLTSSVGAIYTDASETCKAPGKVLNEEVWNSTANLNYQPYLFSKVKAERTAWVIAGSQTQWSLVVINPGLVLGPGTEYRATSESYGVMENLGGGKMKRGCPNYSFALVDVRDVAKAHIAAAFNPNARGRNVIMAENTDLMHMAARLRRKYPDYPLPKTKINKQLLWLITPLLGIAGLTRRGVTNNVDVPIKFDNSKSIKELGMTYRPIEETLNDMYQQLIDANVVAKTGK